MLAFDIGSLSVDYEEKQSLCDEINGKTQETLQEARKQKAAPQKEKRKWKRSFQLIILLSFFYWILE